MEPLRTVQPAQQIPAQQIQIPDDDYRDMLLYANVGVDKLPLDSNLKSMIRNLKGEAQSQAIENIKRAFLDRKENLNFKFGKYLNSVERNYKKINTLDDEERSKVAEKLHDLATQRLVKEKTWGGFHTFFHKIGQLFRGHGFQTKGQYAVKLETKIKNWGNELFLPNLKSAIQTDSLNLDDKTKAKINALPRQDFNHLLEEVIFSTKLGSTFGDNSKFVFFNGLDENKKTALFEQLLARQDWYSQALNIVYGSDVETIRDHFITDEMIEKFSSAPFTRGNRISGFEERFLNLLIVKMLKNIIENNNYSSLGKNLRDLELTIKIKELINTKEDLHVLTPDDIAKLKSNIEGLD